MTAPATPQQLLDLEACRTLLHEFAACVDERRPQDMRALFTTDAGFARPTAPDVLIEGVDAIVASFAARPANVITQHLILNPRITFDGPDAAQGQSVVMLYLADSADAVVPGKGRPTGAPLIGTWSDTFVRTAAGWRFRLRRGAVTLHGARPA